jgi:hypothetical protein
MGALGSRALLGVLIIAVAGCQFTGSPGEPGGDET